MYTARLFTDRLGLPLVAAAALDTLLALNIDLSMDTVAYRLHMWNWNWTGTGLNPLTAQWFGIPYGNFVGWQTVVFCYSAFSRLWERTRWWPGVVALLALICSQVILFSDETWFYPFMNRIAGINSVHRFIAFSILLTALTAWGAFRRQPMARPLSPLAYGVPGWFHFFFFTGFFLFGFYGENPWMTLAACVNLGVGVIIHLWRPSPGGGK